MKRWMTKGSLLTHHKMQGLICIVTFSSYINKIFSLYFCVAIHKVLLRKYLNNFLTCKFIFLSIIREAYFHKQKPN